MTPPATATAAPARPLPRHRPAPVAPRRRSGPAAPRRAPERALAPRLGRAAMRVGDARLLDRLVRGRAWIALVAVALMGLVAMQVSLLKLNAGISRAVTSADTLERQNATLRASISELDSGRRVQAAAARLGMVMPAAGDVRFLDARQADARRAAAAIRAPTPGTTAPATTAATPGVTATAPATATAIPTTQVPATTPTPTATTASATPPATTPTTPTTPAPTITPAPSTATTTPAPSTATTTPAPATAQTTP
jgi:cell division protein FtsB